MKYEYRAAKDRTGPPQLKEKEGFSGLAGFISMFGFNDEASEYIESTRSTRGMDKFPLYADVLYIDFDDNPEAENTTINKLKEMGLAFKVYHTGNRGHHIHISIKPIERVGLPHYMKAVVRNMFKGADDGIYKPTGIIRIPGTYHASTGLPMLLVYSQDGDIMDLDQYRPKTYIPAKSVEKVDKDFLDFMLTRDLNRPSSEGGGPYNGRNNHAFAIAATSVRLELEKETALSLLSDWNTRQCFPPLRESELKATVNSAYRRG